MEPTGAWDALIKQGPVVALLVIILYFGGRYLKSVLDRSAIREDAREDRYNATQDKLVEIQGSQVTLMSTVINRNTEVLNKVAEAYDAKKT